MCIHVIIVNKFVSFIEIGILQGKADPTDFNSEKEERGIEIYRMIFLFEICV